MIATTKFGWCSTAPEYRDESVTPPTRKTRRQRSVKRQGARQVRVERTPLRGLLSKAMELVDDDGERKDRRRHPAARRRRSDDPIARRCNDPDPAACRLRANAEPIDRDRSHHGPTRRRSYDLAQERMRRTLPPTPMRPRSR